MSATGGVVATAAVTDAVVTAGACAVPMAARGRSGNFVAERYGCVRSGSSAERYVSIWSGSYARGMTQGDGSTPEDAEWSTYPPAGDTDAGAVTSFGLGSIPGLPVAVAPLEAAPLEVLLPRVGAAVARHHRRLAAKHGLTPTAVAVLAALDPGDVPSHRDLAARIGLSPATLTPVLDRLEETGDVRRERNRRDRRVVHVHRTAAGGTRVVGARRPDGLLPRPAADSEQVVRAWLLAVLFAAEADE